MYYKIFTNVRDTHCTWKLNHIWKMFAALHFKVSHTQWMEISIYPHSNFKGVSCDLVRSCDLKPSLDAIDQIHFKKKSLIFRNFYLDYINNPLKLLLIVILHLVLLLASFPYYELYLIHRHHVHSIEQNSTAYQQRSFYSDCNSLKLLVFFGNFQRKIFCHKETFLFVVLTRIECASRQFNGLYTFSCI